MTSNLVVTMIGKINKNVGFSLVHAAQLDVIIVTLRVSTVSTVADIAHILTAISKNMNDGGFVQYRAIFGTDIRMVFKGAQLFYGVVLPEK